MNPRKLTKHNSHRRQFFLPHEFMRDEYNCRFLFRFCLFGDTFGAVAVEGVLMIVFELHIRNRGFRI